MCYEMIAMIKSNNAENISDNDCEMIHVNLALRYLNKICEQKGVHSDWKQTSPSNAKNWYPLDFSHTYNAIYPQ